MAAFRFAKFRNLPPKISYSKTSYSCGWQELGKRSKLKEVSVYSLEIHYKGKAWLKTTSACRLHVENVAYGAAAQQKDM
jgi:hypothetical protein